VSIRVDFSQVSDSPAEPAVVLDPAYRKRVNAAALARYPELLFKWFPAERVVGREFWSPDFKGVVGQTLRVNLDNGSWCIVAEGRE
jgi:hypothetical protein